MWDYFDGLSAGEFWTDFGDVALRRFLSIVRSVYLDQAHGQQTDKPNSTFSIIL